MSFRVMIVAVVMAVICGSVAQAQGLLGGLAVSEFGNAGRAYQDPKVRIGPGYLGVTVEPQPIRGGTGGRITSVDPDSPAYGIGLKVGDVLFLAQSRKPAFSAKTGRITNQASLETWQDVSGAGTGHMLRLLRGNEPLYLDVVLADASQRMAAAPPASVTLAPLPANAALPPTGPRVALVIGNSAYDAKLGRLANAGRDAQLIAASLRSVGFEVEVANDLDQKGMKRAIARLGERIATKGPSTTGLFFYAGHGLQSGGTNYLAPIGAVIEKEADIDLESVAADTVLRQMEGAGNTTNIVILDACRNTPVARSTRSASRGFARMDAPNGSFVAYSTAPGSEAVDGTGDNSPFAAALASELQRPGESIEGVFRNVRRAVQESTGGRQTPWDSSSLTNPFFFAGGK